MNIIIPLCGEGLRFKDAGYEDPKPLIRVFEKSILECVIDSLVLKEDDNLFVVYNNELVKERLSEKYSNVHFVKVYGKTQGAVDTLCRGLDTILTNPLLGNRPCVAIDGDTFYTRDILDFYRVLGGNLVFYREVDSRNPIYSYITLDGDRITDIREKELISQNANTGVYCFESTNQLHLYCLKVLHSYERVKNEFYTSLVIRVMLEDNIEFRGLRLSPEHIVSLGTPREYEDYKNRTHAFLFDLDGTLVITDTIYYKVWEQILSNEGITLTPELYKDAIFGNSDVSALRKLGLLTEELSSAHYFSSLKDHYFLKNIQEIKLVEGALDFLIRIRELGHRIAIVTNSNRRVAQQIISRSQFPYNVLVTSNDCKYAKPHPEPYQKAIQEFHISNDRCIIFEDSKAGLVSSLSVNPSLVIGMATNFTREELLHIGVDHILYDYLGANVGDILSECKTPMLNIKNCIQKTLGKEITIHDQKLKGGFIADVIPFTDGTRDYVLKCDSNLVTSVSEMAERLDLQNREYYYYDCVSEYLHIHKPAYYGLVKSRGKTVGMILENMYSRGAKINLDLNKEPKILTYSIISVMANMHAQFWGDPETIESYPNLKGIKRCDDTLFRPFLEEFINERIEEFVKRWEHLILDKKSIILDMARNFSSIQKSLSTTPLTLVHGDVKSPNIFYLESKEGMEIYFIDWQHCLLGKGVQDLIFFLIESFSVETLTSNYMDFVEYYYIVLTNRINYPREEFERDLRNALSYVPFFTAVWFGTTPEDELLDPDFPSNFISKFCALV